MLPVSRRGDQLVITNRKARHDYLVLDTWEAGIMLAGPEVKSMREGRANLQDSYARVDDDEVWLLGMHVLPYAYSREDLDPVRKRKLLLHRKEIVELERGTQRTGHDARAAAGLLQGRPGEGRARARPRQARLRQAPGPRRARRQARGRAGHEGHPRVAPSAAHPVTDVRRLRGVERGGAGLLPPLHHGPRALAARGNRRGCGGRETRTPPTQAVEGPAFKGDAIPGVSLRLWQADAMPAELGPETHRSIDLHQIGEHRWKATTAAAAASRSAPATIPDFTPVELLLAALAGCGAGDLD